MDRQVEEAYRRELLKEREGEIRERTLKKVQVITRSMRPEEEAEYLRSKAFQNALNQTRKKAHTYQAIRGEALPEEWQAEFQRLRPLIQAELRAGHKVELPFLRSVARSRRPLREARQARKWLEEEKPRLFLSQQAGRVAGDLDREIMAWLSRGDLSSLIIPEETHGSVAESLMKRVFRDGIPRQALDEAVPEGSLEKNLEKRVFRQYPALGHCKSLSLSPGGTVGDSTRRQIREAEPEVLLRVRAHFPQGRIRKHLKQNPHIKAWQKERDRNRSDRKNLREALL